MKTLSESITKIIGGSDPVTYDDTDQFFYTIYAGCEHLPPEVDQALAARVDELHDPALPRAERERALLAAFLVAIKHGLETCPPVANGSLCERIKAAARSEKPDHLVAHISRLCGDLGGGTLSEYFEKLGLFDDIKNESDAVNRRANYAAAVYIWLYASMSD